MTGQSPLLLSRQLLALAGTRIYSHHPDRIPQDTAVIVVSNHRSFLDAPVLMAALNRPIRFACHHYMGQVPLLRDFILRLGCFPLDAVDQRQQSFFHQATQLLQSQQMVGIFPEGTEPMVHLTDSHDMGEFHRGFAHLALRAPVEHLAVLPVAIVSQQETTKFPVPLKLLSWFDPSEPLFNQEGWHPMVLYQRADVLAGRPLWITNSQRQSYQGKQARSVVTDLMGHCQTEIKGLLQQI
ncbi:MAG: 1-acyl-sn-glycerol-3-phosphate acyltransferase [Pegethrix bostrychoides GSE-TBD4-15B]|uniref:1-acyl-sn-glycerol-3-phosphate acyltransferase n=1 Tax=Pegethrix bostrychoides GSE-TBD4-15B TaxID=2839662 RepID=A0A951PGY0_9CYAN|nr:1-acyl-sn-glycerol-3-phosphate acyltransferase [Pegethrix bostrychoides GSE-TBD4-15B]